VVGTGLYLTVLGLGSLALIRRASGAIATVVGSCSSCPASSALPASWQNITQYLPSSAGQAIIGPHPVASASSHRLLSPWAGFGLFCAYVVVAYLSAGVVLDRRDS
jgi:hypothetical protein